MNTIQNRFPKLPPTSNGLNLFFQHKDLLKTKWDCCQDSVCKKRSKTSNVGMEFYKWIVSNTFNHLYMGMQRKHEKQGSCLNGAILDFHICLK